MINIRTKCHSLVVQLDIFCLSKLPSKFILLSALSYFFLLLNKIVSSYRLVNHPNNICRFYKSNKTYRCIFNTHHLLTCLKMWHVQFARVATILLLRNGSIIRLYTLCYSVSPYFCNSVPCSEQKN